MAAKSVKLFRRLSPSMPSSSFLFHASFLLLLLTAAARKNALPGCPDSCGNITVPYPFGLSPSCAVDTFDLTCNDTLHPPKLFIYDDVEISAISLLSAEVAIRQPASRACYNATDYVDGLSTYFSAGEGRPFRLSTRNRFTAIGCATFAYFVDGPGYFVSGCVSLCRRESNITDGACTGVGCCQSSISPGIYYYEPTMDDKFNKSTVADFSPCSYWFLVDENEFQFRASDLSRRDDFKTTVALDWAIRSSPTCKEAKLNVTTYACRSQNSFCLDATNGGGYLCNCSRGYEGNPYLLGGCQDIDECKLPEQYICYGQCENTVGGYNCRCPKGQNGDATLKDGCHSKDSFTTALKAITGASIGIFFIVFISLLLYLGAQKRRLMEAKRKFFEQNGGLLVQQQLDSNQSISFKIYSKEELEKAAHNFDDDLILGRGGQGTVYKGVLEDKTVVAIKKSKVIDEGKIKEFVKELLILSQVNHKNVVKLLGCCLEVEVPMLVYEYVHNGTLYHYIHRNAPIPLELRLKIAVEAADALAYLHSSASPPILHGDVKSANILLGDDFSAKVSDFGTSRLAPTDEVQLATLVQGTCGYLDPEYMLTSQLTDKSDVYSFGVVLLELLTRRKAFSFEEPEEDRCLASRFITAMNEDRLSEVLGNGVMGEEEAGVIGQMAELASQCLRITRDERPTMKEVAEFLATLRRYRRHSWSHHNLE